MRQSREKFLQANSIQTKLVLAMALLLLTSLCSNLFVYRQINNMVEKIDSVFASNVSIGTLGDTLALVENRMEEYLNTKSSGALEDYYRYSQDFRELIGGLNGQNVDSATKMLEKNIRSMSETYLEKTEETVQAKRGRNVERYKAYFEEGMRLYDYINYYIYELNSLQFGQNSHNYQMLLSVMGVLETFSTVLILLIFALCLVMAVMTIRTMIKPLTQLSTAAYRVARGEFDVELPQVVSADEVGVVTTAFGQMVESIQAYIEQVKSSVEKEAMMKERELAMEAHLKDAQLKYLQAQINPHFLFNCLNAGAQLAMMEDAEQTEVFMEKMADFFRYNVQKMEGNSTLAEEIQSVDNYIYILNVRYAGEITYKKEISEEAGEWIERLRVPSMILQPIVENAVSHGIHDRMGDGQIRLLVEREGDQLSVSIEDNGAGMTSQEIAAVMERRAKPHREGGSTGIGLDNVMNRLTLYYGAGNPLSMHSQGKGMGTEVTIVLPLAGGGEMDVQNLNRG